MAQGTQSDSTQPRIMKYLVAAMSKIRSAGWAASEGLVNPLLQLLLTPYLLSKLGKEEFGLWILSLAILALGPIITFASSAATFNRLATYRASSEHQKSLAAWKTSIAIVFITSATAAIILTAIETTAPELVKQIHNNGSTISIGLAIIMMLTQEMDSVSGSAIKASGRFDISAKIDIAFRITWVIAVALAASFYETAAACILSATAITATKAGIKALVVKRLYTESNSIDTRPKFKYDRTILATGSWYFGQALSSAMLNAGDKFLVSTLFGLETLSSYAICSQVAQFAHGVQSSAGQPLLPWASKAHKNNKPRRTLLRVAIFGGIAFMLLPIALAISAPYILSAWISPDFANENTTLARALILSYAVLSANIPLHYILLGTDHLKLVTALNILGGTTSLLTGLLIADLGIVYFALSKAIYSPITMLGLTRLKTIDSHRQSMHQ